MKILVYLAQNWDSALLFVAVVTAAVILYKRGEIALLKTVMFKLVTKAEQEYGGGTGELKKAAVVEWIYERLPAVLRVIVSQREIERLIDEVLEYAKKKWAANKDYKTYISGGIPE